ncbi:2517_t:CDS:2 [Funneliformis geosporum]|uniref:2517_t:CDS:1 n=1 Tax=Funneliformis geosporum TaxID=1117311 RepID=A0A9W4SQG4_9GLOM|nr:2517_t:CDS:2 [Funneliformis geosporum]
MAICLVLCDPVTDTFVIDITPEMYENKLISHIRGLVYSYNVNSFAGIDEKRIKLWKVTISTSDTSRANKKLEILKSLENSRIEIDTVRDLGGVFLPPGEEIRKHFNENEKLASGHIHIIVEPPMPATTTGPLRGVTQVFENIEEVLKKAESHWAKLKDKLVEKFELKEFRVSDHIYKDCINASGIPVIKGKPSFLLHSLPNSDNKEGYIPENILSALLDKVMTQRWLFLMGTSGSGKTRSLYELFCSTYGIYFSLNTGNGSKNNNFGSRDMDKTIEDLGFKLVPNKSQENINIALMYTRAMLLSRLFILTKLLEFHTSSNSTNFTPKQWLLMQLLPLQIHDEDFWISIASDFRNLDPLCQDKLVTEFIKKFQNFVPEQKQLPIAIDESQSAIEKYEKMFPSTNSGNQLRPFFVILLRMVLKLTTMKLCLILSGTGMSFEDIKNFTSSTIAKPNGPSFEDFFFIHDGFYENSEMSNYIQRFLPLNDESMKSIFNIFRGRRRFLVQFLDKSLLDTSSMSRDVNENMEKWQRGAKDFIISTFKESCFPKLREDKEVWNKVMDIVTLSMFSNSAMVVRGGGVIEMVQYGFAQLCDFNGLVSDQDIFQKDVIEVQIAETIPFLAFREYIKEDCHNRNEIEEKLLQNLCSIYYNASCAGFLFEPYLPIALEELFNEKICKEHRLFTDIKNIDKLGLLSYKATIRNLHNSTIFCSKGDMKKFNLLDFLNDPSTAFFMPEKDAGPDLVCIIKFETPDEIVEVPLFLQAKLWTSSPPSNATFATDPNSFYSHGDDPSRIPQLKIELKKKVINCLRTKYHRAYEHGLSWIRFLVVYPAKFNMQSHYIHKERDKPRRSGTAYNLEANELLVIIDHSNAKHFFSSLGLNVLNAVKRVDEKEIDMERPKKRLKLLIKLQILTLAVFSQLKTKITD